MLTEEQLKPCPFCGANVKMSIIQKELHEPYFSIECFECRIGTWIYKNKEELIGKWNTRAE